MKKREERHQKPFNVEFGMEFGDMNASKLYERPLTREKPKSSAKKGK